MAESISMEMEALAKEKVEEELKTVCISKKDMTKTAKDEIDTLLPGNYRLSDCRHDSSRGQDNRSSEKSSSW